jgi:glyoxylase-like metal-dependent hydrolase (beta-lactamase superfamily II)
MKYLLQIVLITFTLISCKPNKQAYDNYESDSLKIEQIGHNVYTHTSYLETKSLGTVPCNGMIYFNENEAIIFDTPINNKASSELIKWVGKKKIKAIVVTHFHVDCLGGLKEFHSNGIESYSTEYTIKLAKESKKEVLPKNGFDNQHKFQIGNEVVFAKYFGQGHTKDNSVGYIPSEKNLFGGCMIKSLNAPKGNLADANTSEWSMSVEKLKKELSDIEIVIPGHGKSGGTELLDYTINLFKIEKKRTVIFLHNRFLENHKLNELHPEYGKTEYKEILSEFEKNGLNVISEKRSENVNTREYALGVVNQIDSLISNGIKPNEITVVGTSKGGYIAQYVSTLANNPKLNFVFIASFQNNDIQNIPEINYCGNILTIFEKSDLYGVSALEREQNSTCKIENFKEIELNTGLRHGFLFKPLKEWIEPTVQWAKGDYDLE